MNIIRADTRVSHGEGGCALVLLHPDFDHMTISVIHWQMSAIRISGASRQRVIALAAHILHSWEAYEDTSVGVYAYTEKDGVRTPHNAITPIARFNAKGEYELDLVLRNNRTSEEFPDGIFHPHPHLHHIKKENIGLIEVMGLAVLPGRLDKELSLISRLLTGAKAWEDFSQGEQEALEKHVPWITDMQSRYGQVSTEEEADDFERSRRDFLSGVGVLRSIQKYGGRLRGLCALYGVLGMHSSIINLCCKKEGGYTI
ncbi:MAG: hypothetical protein ACLTXL_00270 [Clostridia bacterium]